MTHSDQPFPLDIDASTREERSDLASQARSNPSLSVSIVSHNAKDALRRCLLSLQEYPYGLGDMEIVVLDNASEDGTVPMLRSEFPEVTLITSNRRRGFGANQNAAIAASSGELVYILNPDVEVERFTIDRLVEALVAEPTARAAAGPVRNIDGTMRQARPLPFPTVSGVILKAFGVRRFLHSSEIPESPITDGWPSGGACLVDRDTFDELGGFDETFFMYSEDTDFFSRLVVAGHAIVWVADAPVTHPFPQDSSEWSQRRLTEMVRSDILYARKRYGAFAVLVYRAGLVIDAALRVIAFSIPGVWTLGQKDGMGVAYNRRFHAARLRASLAGGRGVGLAESADVWNRKHGV